MIWSVILLGIINDLILGPQHRPGIVGHPVLDAAIGSSGNFPLTREFEVFESFLRVQVACLTAAKDTTIFHYPTFSGWAALAVSPTDKGFAVEELNLLDLGQGKKRINYREQ